ncbi:MAG: ATP-binding protein, partial [Cyclobacteriaceae bacterium]|nr:ATP-binding protein [Cyclobacteriaceae bacterium]
TDGLLFCDTNLIVVKIWSDHKYGTTDSWILEQLDQRSYDFYLLANIDLPWRPDPQREHPDRRLYFFELYQQYLIQHDLPYAIVSGDEDLRVKCALDALNSKGFLH